MGDAVPERDRQREREPELDLRADLRVGEVPERLERRRERRVHGLVEESEGPGQRPGILEASALGGPGRAEHALPRVAEGREEPVPRSPRGSLERGDRGEELGGDDAEALPVGERPQREDAEVGLEEAERASDERLGFEARSEEVREGARGHAAKLALRAGSAGGERPSGRFLLRGAQDLLIEPDVSGGGARDRVARDLRPLEPRSGRRSRATRSRAPPPLTSGSMRRS